MAVNAKVFYLTDYRENKILFNLRPECNTFKLLKLSAWTPDQG